MSSGQSLCAKAFLRIDSDVVPQVGILAPVLRVVDLHVLVVPTLWALRQSDVHVGFAVFGLTDDDAGKNPLFEANNRFHML